MVEIFFKTVNHKKILKVSIDFNKKVIFIPEVAENKKEIANIYLKDYKTCNYNMLEKTLSSYLDINRNLEDIVKYIEENGFYTPYKPNLRIIVGKDK